MEPKFYSPHTGHVSMQFRLFRMKDDGATQQDWDALDEYLKQNSFKVWIQPDSQAFIIANHPDKATRDKLAALRPDFTVNHSQNESLTEIKASSGVSPKAMQLAANNFNNMDIVKCHYCGERDVQAVVGMLADWCCDECKKGKSQ
jgi:hypothetical protein